MCDIAANFTESDESFNITSRAENMYYLARLGPNIRLISWRLDAIGIFTSYIGQNLQCFCDESVDWTVSP